MVLFFTHIPFVVNHIINATPPESLQHHLILQQIWNHLAATGKIYRNYEAWASGRFLPEGRLLADFCRSSHKDRSKGGLNAVKFPFSFWKQIKRHFFAENVIEKGQISKSRKARSPCPTFPCPRVGRCFSFCKWWGHSRCHYLKIACNLFTQQSLCD